MSDPETLLKQAWAADKAGHSSDAINLFKQILREHPSTTAALDARQYLAGTSDPLGAGGNVKKDDSVQVVRVIDLNIRFVTMVALFVKAAIAMIPAVIILAVLYALFQGVLLGLIAGFG